MTWDSAVNTVTPHVVKIETPGGHGTGFLAFYNGDGQLCAIATAAHVVEYADYWQQPMRIWHQGSAGPRFLNASERVIYLDHRNDSAVVLFFKGELALPQAPVPLMPVGEPCGIGVEIGWLGFPGIEPNTLCFFAGTVSASQPFRKSYLIDGVAINGVSGGPVFHVTDQGGVQIIGLVSAYHANRATGEALPGLLRAQDVSHFHEVLHQIQDIDEANAKKREFEESQKAKSEDEPGAAAEQPLQGAAAEPQQAGPGGEQP